MKSIKYDTIAGLATVNPNCPMQIWDKMLRQMQDTLNMLRTSRRDKTKSAFHELKGKFDFDRAPMSVLGSKALAYVDSEVRASWGPHALDAFYVGRCKQHYRLLEF